MGNWEFEIDPSIGKQNQYNSSQTTFWSLTLVQSFVTGNYLWADILRFKNSWK